MSDEIKARPCPFCGGAAEIERQLNCDTLIVRHKRDCFLGRGRIALERFHWNEPKDIPAIPFQDWNTRATDADNVRLRDLLREAVQSMLRAKKIIVSTDGGYPSRCERDIDELLERIAKETT